MPKGGGKKGGRGGGGAGPKAAPIARPSGAYDYKVACRAYGLGDEKAARDAEREREAAERQKAREAGEAVDLGKGQAAWVAAATGKQMPKGGKGSGYSNSYGGGGGGGYSSYRAAPAPAQTSAGGNPWGSFVPTTTSGGNGSSKGGRGQDWNKASWSWKEDAWQGWSAGHGGSQWEAAAPAAASPPPRASSQWEAAAPAVASPAVPAAAGPPASARAGVAERGGRAPPLVLDVQRGGLTNETLETLRLRRQGDGLGGATLRLPKPDDTDQELFWRVLELACNAKPRPPMFLQLGSAEDLGQLAVVVEEAESRGLKASHCFQSKPADEGNVDVIIVMTRQLH